MSAQLEAILDQFFKKHPELEPNDDNRRELIRGVEELHKSVISTANMENVLKQHKDVFMFRKLLPPVFWPVKDQEEMLDICSQRLGFRILTSNANIHTILSLLQRAANGVVTLENVFEVCQALGKSGLEHYSPAPPTPVPAVPPPNPVFDWTTTSNMQDIPLTDPEGNPPPNWYIQALNRSQTRSYVKRLQESNRPAKSTELREGQLPLDADEATMKLATPKQLANLIQRQRAAKYHSASLGPQDFKAGTTR
jgi:hypothetical protein